MAINYNPEIDDSYPREVRRFNDEYYTRQLDESDGEVFYDDTRVFALVSPDTTTLGNGDTPNMIRFNYERADYDRAEWTETKRSDSVKFWVFTYDGKDIAVKYKYIKMVRNIFDVSLDEIRRSANAITDNLPDQPQPIVIDCEGYDYKAIIMPHATLSD